MNRQEEITIVEHNQANAVMVSWNPNNSQVTAFAADEAKKYVKKISNVDLTSYEVSLNLTPDHISSAVFIISGQLAEKYVKGEVINSLLEKALQTADGKLKGKHEDSFVILGSDDCFCLSGQNDRGTLYAVYSWTEKLGVRYFAPEYGYYMGFGESIPSLSTLSLPLLEEVEEPSLLYRRKYAGGAGSHSAKTLIQLIDWMAKKRFNGIAFASRKDSNWDEWRDVLIPELAKRGMYVELGGHGYHTFLPEEVYKKDHPEWYPDPAEPIVGLGKKVNIFRFTNEEALQQYIDNVIQYLKEHPEVTIFDAWPPDGATWAEQDVKPYGSIANATAYITNRLAAAVKEVLPHVMIEQISYIPSADPPDEKYMYDESIMIDFAPYDRTYTDAFGSSTYEIDEYYAQLPKAWKDKGFKGIISTYEYYVKGSWRSLPVVLPHLIVEDIAHLQQQGLNGLEIYCEAGNWLTYELTHLIAADVSWDVSLNADAYIETYLSERFGQTKKWMRSYFKCIEETGSMMFDRPHGNYGDLKLVEKALANYKESKTILNQALDQAESETAEAMLIQRLIINMDYAIIDTELNYYELTNQTEKYDDTLKECERIINDHFLDGVIYKNAQTLRRIYNIPKRPVAGEMVTWARDQYREMWK